MNPADLLRWPIVIPATIVYFVLRHTTNPSEATKRVMDLGWILFWFFVLALATRNMDIDPAGFLVGVVLIVAGAALRGTSAGRYFGVALGGFIGMLLLIFIVQAILHPNAWCPSPMYIDNQGICRQP